MSTTFGLPNAIVKVQLPLASSDPNPLPLIYDKEMAHPVQQPINSKTLAALNGDVKGYFQATFDGDVWIIGKRLPDQLWRQDAMK